MRKEANKWMKELEEQRRLTVDDPLEIKNRKVSIGRIEQEFTYFLNNLKDLCAQKWITKTEYEEETYAFLKAEHYLLDQLGYDREKILKSEE